MSLAAKLLRGSGANFLDLTIKSGVVFFTMPLMLKHLGSEGYATWALATSVIGWVMLWDASVTYTAARFLAIEIGAKNKSRQASLLVILERFFRGTLALVAALTLAAAFWLPWYSGSSVSSSEVTIAVLLCGGAVALRCRMRACFILLRSEARYDLLAWISIIRLCVQTPLLYWALDSKRGLIGVAAAQACGEVIELALQHWRSRQYDHASRDATAGSDNPYLERELLLSSAQVLIGNIGQSLRLSLCPFILTSLHGVGHVGPFSVGSRLISMVEDVVNAVFGGQLLVVFGQMHGAQNAEHLRRQFLRVTRVTAGVGAALMCGAVWVSGPFLQRWIGDGMAEARIYFLVLALPFALHFTQYPAHSLINTMGRIRSLMWLCLASGITGVLAACVLGYWFGPVGVLGGSALAMLVDRAIALPWLVRRCLGGSAVSYLAGSVLWPAFRSVTPLLLTIWLLDGFVRPDYGRLALLVVSFGLVFVGTFPWTVLDAEDRSLLGKYFIPRLFRRV